MMRNKVVCFFNSTKAWGGGERWHLDMSQRIENSEFEPLVITNKKSELYKRAQLAGLNTYAIKITNLSFLNIFKVLKVAKVLKKNNVQYIIMNLPADLKIAGLSAKITGITNIIFRRGSAIPIRNTILNRFFYKTIITGIIANSEETKRTINANNPKLFPEKKIEVIYNGLDLKNFDSQESIPMYQREENEIILGNSGRLVPQKSQKDLIEIARKLKEKKIQFKMLIVGKGKLLEYLKNLAKNLGVEKEVIFPGFIENTKAFYDTIDLFLLTSVWEGFGYVIAEAMAAKKAVVAYNVSSNPELIVNNKTGFLVEKNNDDAVVEKIEWFISNPAEIKHFGENGRKRVEDMFVIDKTSDKLLRFLRNC